MARSVVPKTEDPAFILPGKGALAKLLEEKGRMPPVAIRVQPLDGSEPFYADRFVSYKFSSSILIPVDTFSFNIALDDLSNDPKGNVPQIRLLDGDLITLEANRIPLSTGILDSINIQTDAQTGSSVALEGRDLLAQWEDQDAISVDAEPIYASQLAVKDVVRRLARDTRIPSTPELRDISQKAYLFATQPGETKLSAFQRYCESLNVLFWLTPQGKLIVGKPNMTQAAKETLFIKRGERQSNVLSMRATRASTSIPNVVVAIWNGQESVQARVSKDQVLYNKARGPARLRALGHRVPKCVIVSTPEGSAPQDLAAVNILKATAGGSTLLQAYAKREIARANKDELIVQVQALGHYNSFGEPYSVDTVYRIQYDLAGVDENMYLFQVEYEMSEGGSQLTQLFFCRLGCLVSDLRVV